jgi:tellurium resistance protein TerD
MAVDLQKGAKISLTKGNDGIQNVRAGLKWESRCDVDASIIMLDGDKKMKEIVYFGKKTSSDGAIFHRGDDTTGSNIQGVDGDNENIDIKLNMIRSDVQELLVVANIYNGPSRGQDFSNLEHVRIRMTDLDKKNVLATYDLAGRKGINAAVVARIYRRPNGAWNLEAVGEEYNLANGRLGDLTKKYEGGSVNESRAQTSPANDSRQAVRSQQQTSGGFLGSIVSGVREIRDIFSR